MDMNSSEAMPPDLTDAGMNMTNLTVAYNFLQDILDYTGFQPEDQTIDEAFWYGIVIVIGIAAIFNFIQWATLRIRSIGSQLTLNVIESAPLPPTGLVLPRPPIP
jgi:ferric-chelate reductase